MDLLVSLQIVADTLEKQRFAGMDQNPKGIRDLIGSAVHQLTKEREEHDRRVTELLEANTREVERRRHIKAVLNTVYGVYGKGIDNI